MEWLAEQLIAIGLWSFVNDHDCVWPVAEIFHFLGMAMLISTVGLLDLRLLEYFKGIPIAGLEKLIPIGIAGFIVNAATGLIFVVGNPIGGPIVYLTNLSFQIKFLLIAIAGLNLLLFRMLGINHAAAAAGADGDAGGTAKVVAGTSIVLWIGVIVFGRLIMYNDTLLYALGL